MIRNAEKSIYLWSLAENFTKDLSNLIYQNVIVIICFMNNFIWIQVSNRVAFIERYKTIDRFKLFY